jgi:hypothetical protein
VNERSTRRTKGEPARQKSAAATDAFVTLQRPPPLIRILAPRRAAPSRTSGRSPGRARAAKIAQASPAAPPPTTTTGCV